MKKQKASVEFSINEKIALLAKLKKINQRQIASEVGVSPSHINHFFRGRSEVQSGLLIAILQTLDLDIEKTINREVAKINRIDLEKKATVGESIETICKMLDKPEREAILNYIIAISQSALGNKATNQIKNIKQLI